MQSLTDLLDIAVGYQKSLTLFTFVELEIADVLQKAPLKSEEIARRVKIHPLAAERFLNTCVSIGILRKTEDLYASSEIAGRFLTKSDEFFLAAK